MSTHLSQNRKYIRNLIRRGSWGQYSLRGSAAWEPQLKAKNVPTSKGCSFILPPRYTEDAVHTHAHVHARTHHISTIPLLMRFCVHVCSLQSQLPWSFQFLQFVLYAGQRPAVVWHSSMVTFAEENCFMQNKRQQGE